MDIQERANNTMHKKQKTLKENVVTAFTTILSLLLVFSATRLFGFEQPFNFEQQIGAAVSPSGNTIIAVKRHVVYENSHTNSNPKTTIHLEFIGEGKTKPLQEKISPEQGAHDVVDAAWAYDSSVLAFRLQNRLRILRVALRQSELDKPHLGEFAVTEENEFISSFCWPDAGKDDPRSLLLVLKRFCSEEKESQFIYGADKGEYDRVRIVRLDINSGQITELLNHGLKSPLPCSYNFLNAAAEWNEISPTASCVLVEDSDSWSIYKFDNDKKKFTFYKKIPAREPVDAVWWITPRQIVFGARLFTAESPRFYLWDIQSEKAEDVTGILAPDGECDRLYPGGNLSGWIRNTLEESRWKNRNGGAASD